MAPTLKCVHPGGRETLEGDYVTALSREREGIPFNAVESGNVQRSDSTCSMELIDQRAVSDIPALNDGRRRSSRLKGKISCKNAEVCGGSSPAVKESSGSRKKDGRKKTAVLESVQSVGDSNEELKSDVNVEAFPQELAMKSESAGANAVDNTALAGSSSLSEESTLLHETDEVKAAKVKKLKDLDISDESCCVDKEDVGATGPVVGTRGDFCDSNIFENLQSIVNLQPEENVVRNEVPSVSKSEAQEMIDSEVANTSKVNLKNEESRKTETGHVKGYPEGSRAEKPVSHDVSDLKIVHNICVTTAEATTVRTGSEAGPVLSDFKDEGISRGSNSVSKIGEDTLKLYGNDGEDSSSVTSQDDIAHATAISLGEDIKAASGNNARGGVSIVASNTSSNDIQMVTSPGFLAAETTHSNYRMQKLSNSVLEGTSMTHTTFEATSLRLVDEVGGRFLLGQKSDSLKSVNQETGLSTGDVGALKVESSSEFARNVSSHTDNTGGGEDDSSGVTEGDGEKVDESVSINSKAGWVKCDDCDKWRSIPVDLAEKIGETNAYWSCKDNPNKQFADCSIPQVKSNEEINRDLGISESSLCDEDDDEEHDETCDSKPMYNGIQENGQSVWTLIKRNIFKHRSQKHQDADEAMVCQCAPPKPGEVGCGEDCLNRILNVECLPQQCPCGPLCTNQQFQKRSYANVELFRCGKKGHGLRALENIPRGTFITEYVGEVLDMPSFEARQKEYSMNSQKHFYFMTLSANEIIDACSKGNLGRFINHSCEPNCQTEKWMVDGEVCIGLFAIRDVKKGEEVTFDYNFVRVGGADAKKCECGANKCRGFIGVDPDTPQNVVDIDSDDGEDPEPIMLCAESDEDLGGNADKGKQGAVKKARITGGSEIVRENKWKLGGVKRKFYLGGAKDIESPKKSRRVKTAAISKVGSHRLVPSRVFAGSRSGTRRTYQSDVEEKLGELTNESGGLRKQKDVAKQYLKLLVLTAASGGSVNGAAACSARDLSMLLEALLKTQKFSLLKDIMDKNGLQMFHNLLKQFRKSFEKRPILRKLLKVLDYLAKNRVLTLEHIFSPPRSGTECFSDTLFDLSRHDDMEVQNMARTFRKIYVPPRPHKVITSNEQPLAKLSLQQIPVTLSASAVEFPQGGSSANNSAEHPSIVQGGPLEGTSANPLSTSRRKRPSRWDTVLDSEITTASVSSGFGVCHGALPYHQQGGLSEQTNPSFTPRSEPPAPSASQQPSTTVPSDPSPRSSVSSTPTGIPGRPSGPFPPAPHHGGHHMVQPGVMLHQGFPPGHSPVGLPGQRPAIPSGPMHMGLPRGPMANEVPPMSQRSYSGGKLPRSDMLSLPHPLQGGPLPVPAAGMHHTAFPYHQGHSNQASGSIHGVPPVQWPSMYPVGGPMFGGPPLAPPPPPLPPSGIPWGQNGPRLMDGFAGNTSRLSKQASEASGGHAKRGYSSSLSSSMRTANHEPTGPETAREPPVPGLSPTDLRSSRTSERTLSRNSEPSQGSLRSHNESSVTRLETPPHTHRDECGARITGNDSKVSNRFRSTPNNVGLIQQAHSYPDCIEGVHDKGQRVTSWDTPECSSFHHHVSGMVRARVEMKQLVHYKDFEKFCSKLTDVVTRKEIKKYRENRTQGMAKVILRSKLLEKVDAYVDLQIRLYSKSNKLKSGDGHS